MKTLRVCFLVGVIAALSACTRAPSEEALKADLQATLETGFAPGLLEVTDAHRANWLPYILGDHGRVGYDAKLRLKRDHRFGAWDQVNIGTLLLLLHVAPSDVEGVKSGGNVVGDTIHVRGYIEYVTADGALKPAPETSTAQTERARDMVLISDLKRLARETWSGIASSVETSRTGLFLDEWRRARRAIAGRTARDDGGFSIATSPKNGIDWQLGRAAQRSAAAENIAFANVATDDAQEALDFLRTGRVSAAVIRNTLANLAVNAAAPFENAGPYRLAALGALYPEPVHVIVKDDSPLGSPAELFGKHVGVAGTDRVAAAEAEAILRGHGVPLNALAAPPMAVPLAEALDQLSTGAFDALVMTSPLPNADLRAFAATHPIRLLPFDSDAIAFLTSGMASYVAITIPARTYPGQARPLAAVAAVTMLVSVDSVPASEATRLLTLMVDRVDYLKGGSIHGAMISRKDAQRPMTLPWHPGASEFFGLVVKE